MTVRDIQEILHATVISGEEHTDREVHTACGSDMMSDVLAFVKDQSVLLTGLVNPQVVRTADMMDLAESRDIVLMNTNLRMFTACGLLYDRGLRGGNDGNE